MWLSVTWFVCPDRAVNLKQRVPAAKLSIIEKVAQILDIIHVILVPYLLRLSEHLKGTSIRIWAL